MRLLVVTIVCGRGIPKTDNLLAPLELIPVLKIVSDLWVMHTAVMREIMDRVAKMYDKLVLVDEAFTKAESGIESARKQCRRRASVSRRTIICVANSTIWWFRGYSKQTFASTRTAR